MQKSKEIYDSKARLIDFLAVKVNNAKIKVKKSGNNNKFEKNRWIDKNICLLKSGNILVYLDKLDKNTYKLKILYIYMIIQI